MKLDLCDSLAHFNPRSNGTLPPLRLQSVSLHHACQTPIDNARAKKTNADVPSIGSGARPRAVVNPNKIYEPRKRNCEYKRLLIQASFRLRSNAAERSSSRETSSETQNATDGPTSRARHCKPKYDNPQRTVGGLTETQQSIEKCNGTLAPLRPQCAPHM